MFAAFLLSALPLVAPQGDEPTGQATVYRLDHIETLTGDALQNASIVVRDGVIERIGQSVIVPDHARVIEFMMQGSRCWNIASPTRTATSAGECAPSSGRRSSNSTST